MWFEDKEKVAELELKARLAQSSDVKEFKEILLNMMFDYAQSDIDDKEVRGMARLLANTRDWDKKLDKKIKNAKETI
jgi:hypothetical protein